MKLNKLVLLFTLSLFIFISCSKDSEIIDPTNDVNFVLDQTEFRSFVTCSPWDQECSGPPLFPYASYFDPIYKSINVSFEDVTTEEEVLCIRKQYFSCFPELRMSTRQPPAFNKDVWLVPLDNGRPGDTISDTIDQDDRTCKGPSCD